MKKKDLLWLFISTLVATAITPIILPSTTAQEKAAIAVSPLLTDTRNLKQVGETFSINVTIAHVTKLWGYEYALFYNTSVINATNFEKLDERFQKDLPSEIGDEFVSVSRGTSDGDSQGITTTDPIPVDRIDFIVTGSGTTSIYFSPNPKFTALAAVGGLEIESLRVNGRFSNTELLETHDVGVTEASLSKTSAAPGDIITISAVVTNVGDLSEDVTVTAKFNETGLGFTQIGTAQTITNLATDSSSDPVTFTWDTAGVLEGVYEVTVYATIPVDDKVSDNVRIAGIMTLTTGGGGGGIPMEAIYVAAGIAIVIVAVVAVYALRARK